MTKQEIEAQIEKIKKNTFIPEPLKNKGIEQLETKLKALESEPAKAAAPKPAAPAKAKPKKPAKKKKKHEPKTITVEGKNDH